MCDSRIIYQVDLYDCWIVHLKKHPDACIECEICLRGDYKEPHTCIFINLNGSSCGNVGLDFWPVELQGTKFDLDNLMESQKKFSLQGDLNVDSHFYYFASLLLEAEALAIAEEIRHSTTNRYSTEVPGKKIISKYQIPIPPSGLFRGVRVNSKIFRDYCNLGVGQEFLLSNHVLSMTELFGRGLDYSKRKRPLDAQDIDSGILLELNNFQGLPIAALSTYPVEREWRVVGNFFVEEVLQNVSPKTLTQFSEDWALKNWDEAVDHVDNWCYIRIMAEKSL